MRDIAHKILSTFYSLQIRNRNYAIIIIAVASMIQLYRYSTTDQKFYSTMNVWLETRKKANRKTNRNTYYKLLLKYYNLFCNCDYEDTANVSRKTNYDRMCGRCNRNRQCSSDIIILRYNRRAHSKIILNKTFIFFLRFYPSSSCD